MTNLGVGVKPDDQVQPKVRSTPNGGCYISWFDNDPSGNPPFGYDVDLQRLDKHGVAQFPAGGIRSPFAVSSILSSSLAGAIVTVNVSNLEASYTGRDATISR